MTNTPLFQARTLLGITQQRLADEAGTTKSLISELETGRALHENTSHGTIVRIVAALQRLGLPGASTDSIFPVKVEEAA